MGGERIDRIRKYVYPISIVLLTRKGRFYREAVLKDLAKYKNAEILCITASESSFDIEALHDKFLGVKFLLLKADISVGEKLNIGIDEAKSPFVLAMWDDMKISSFNNLDMILKSGDLSGNLCTCPLLKGKKMQTVPSVMVPGFLNNELKVANWFPKEEEVPTIFPFDYTGIYNKEKFLISGGFDYTLTNPYWQKLDFGFRSYMWGETMLFTKKYSIQYLGNSYSEDSTPDESYKYFYLKNITVRFKRDKGVIPFSQFLKFIIHSDTGPLYAYQEFKKVKKWVRINRYRFKQDALRVIDLWDITE
ncbi:MAG: hypothetical protein J7K04_04475 [Spirochaetales bacterium]|nr:hypothetical protein [Spirochaetales bacterium]